MYMKEERIVYDEGITSRTYHCDFVLRAGQLNDCEKVCGLRRGRGEGEAVYGIGVFDCRV